MRAFLFVIAVGAALGFSVFVMRSEAIPVVSHVEQTSLYRPSLVRSGGMRVELYGAPVSGVSREEVAASVPIPGWISGGRAHLADTAGGPYAGARLVLFYNGPAAPSLRMCIDPERFGGAVGDGPLRVTAVYCVGDRMAARGALSAAAISGLDDPAYRRAMSQLMASMLPANNINVMGPSGG